MDRKTYSMPQFGSYGRPAFPDMDKSQIRKIVDDLNERLKPELRENALREARAIKAARDIILSV